MSVRVTIRPDLLHFDSYREAATETEGKTIGECLKYLVQRHPMLKNWLFEDNGDLNSSTVIGINGEEIFPVELEKPVKDDDELSITVLVAGG
jgi:molybdopterin converting factor small subunit